MEHDNKYDPTKKIGKLIVERKTVYEYHYTDPNNFQMTIDLLNGGYTMEEILEISQDFISLSNFETKEIDSMTFLTETLTPSTDKKINYITTHTKQGKDI